jgi:hypothetical protein
VITTELSVVRCTDDPIDTTFLIGFATLALNGSDSRARVLRTTLLLSTVHWLFTVTRICTGACSAGSLC